MIINIILDMKNIKRVFKDPRLILIFILSRYCHWMNDELYLKILYFLRMGKMLHLNPPVTYNEKLQWLKLHDRHPEYTQMVDKAMAKEYAAGIIGNEYIIPTLGVWDKFEDIDFDTLPNQFVLKCTHDSGGVVICTDKDKLDISKAKKKINRSMRRNYFYGTREYPYKNVKPRIIAEEYMEDENKELVDYKLLCFNEEVKYSLVCSERFSKAGLKVTFFDREWNKLPITQKDPSSDLAILKPYNYDKMIVLAEKIAKKVANPFVRIDFYDIRGHIYFGEITFYPTSGLSAIKPEKWDRILGDEIKI